MDERLIAFKRLLEVMDKLRDKCPWDKKQTFESLRHLTIEETYELSDAILRKNMDAIKKELGDLMLHLVFYAKIGSEQKAFDIKDIMQTISEKLIQRHPHIYGDVKVKDADEVKDNWEKIKMKEEKTSVLEGVPLSLPPLIKAFRMQEKASGIGFDWETADQVWEKIIEELNELKNEIENKGDKTKIETELGDLFFTLVNYARFLKINPEDALENANRKFLQRFKYMEENIKKSGKILQDMSIKEMDVFWEEAKKIETK